MASAMTVLGPVTADRLGRTLMHEHVLVGFAGVQYDSCLPEPDRATLIETCTAQWVEIKELGFQTVVDTTPADLSRDADLLAEVSRRSGVNIVCATGLYSRLPVPYFNHYGTDAIAEFFIKEITDGIGGTGVKPGIIKCATSHNQITAYEEKVLRAAARAHRATGAPITTHTEEGTMGPEQVAVFESEGVDLRRVIIGHSNDNTDLRYQSAILDRGANVGFDRFGYEMHTADRFQVATLVGVLAMGFVTQVVLSHDKNCAYLGRAMAPPPPHGERLANWNYTHLTRDILPGLLAAGVSQRQIDTMLIDNPRRILAGA
ncbi:MAG: phosphotriesterase-related protein [Candidatus Binatia bacterium]